MDTTLTLVRTIKAPAEQIFAAWTEAGLLRQWLASDAEADARMGGHFRMESVGAGHECHVVTGEYQEFVPNRRFVMTWIYQGSLAETGVAESQVSLELRSLHPGLTDLYLKHEHLADAGYRNVLAQEAWTDALDKLEALLTGLRPEHVGQVEDRVQREISIAAPVERVWAVVIEMGHLGGWQGKADPQPGALVPFQVGDATFLIQFEQVQPPYYLAYSGARTAGEEPRPGNSTRVEYTLTPEGSGTRLRVVESGFASLDWPVEEKARFARGNIAGWSAYLDHVQESVK